MHSEANLVTLCSRCLRTTAPRLIALGLLAVVVGCGNASEEPARETPTETIEAPIDVRMTYNISDWTFEKSGTSVNVTAIFYVGQDGSEAAKNVCNLTLYSVDGVERVTVTWQNGREYCEHWKTE